MFDLEKARLNWLDKLREKGQFLSEQVEELESHLMEEIDELTSAGLSGEEAFIIAVKRIGNSDLLSSEYAKVNTGTIWKQLTIHDTESNRSKKTARDILLILGLSLVAGFLAKLPEYLGLISQQPLEGWDLSFFSRNIGLYFIPCVAVYFLLRQAVNLKRSLILAVLFVLSAVVINLYPLREPYHTGLLSGIHLALFLWLAAGVLYGGDRWRESRRRMDFIRHSGETFIYGTLLGCGIAVFTLFTLQIFDQINVDIGNLYTNNIMFYLVFAVPLVAVYLVDAKKSIIENIAPILARIFSPLFLITMFMFLVAVIFLHADPYSDRDFLIIFNMMLILVLALVLYVISARKPAVRATPFDLLNFILIVLAVAIDGIVLSAIIFRIGTYGFTANRTSALGINLILLGNLTGLAVYYIRFFLKHCAFEAIEKWQTGYLYAYFGWCGFVAFLFPVIFRFA